MVRPRREREDQDGIALRLQDLLVRARAAGASDIHFEPGREGARVRFRVDGTLREGETVPPELWPRFLGRLKLWAGLDLLDSLRPQDGVLRQEGFSCRVATLPSLQGEKVAIRLLEGVFALTLEDLGFEDEVVASLRQLLEGTGLVVLAGPASSGKTTTLYACLVELAAAGKSAVAAEDPVESLVGGITQVPVRSRAGVGFTEVMRAALRQDPQVLAVGEVRDPESARATVRAALGGHLVLCTLHAGDALAALARFLELGTERRQLAAALQGMVELRLFRCLCRECGGKGCPECASTGWRGREPLAAVLPVTRAFRLALAEDASPERLQRLLAPAEPNLRAQAERKLGRGVTRREEVERALGGNGVGGKVE